MRYVSCFLMVLPVLAQEMVLFTAARDGDVARLRVLAREGSNRRLRNAFGRTALHEAARHCRAEAAALLVSAGWDRAARDGEGLTPVMAVRCEGNRQRMELARLLLAPVAQPPEDEHSLSTLTGAAAHGHANLVAMLLKLGAEVNRPGAAGNRALEIACVKGHAEIVRLLLEGGADPRLGNKDGATPLHDAALGGNRAIIALLLAHGAAIDAAARDGAGTPLHYAASFARLEAVKELLRQGANPAVKDAAGRTPVELAERNNHTEVAAVLRSTTPPPK